MNMNEDQMKQFGANVRRHTLKEAAQAICPFCRPGNPWNDAQCVDGVLYEHFQMENANNKRPCAASEIWKLRDAE